MEFFVKRIKISVPAALAKEQCEGGTLYFSACLKGIGKYWGGAEAPVMAKEGVGRLLLLVEMMQAAHKHIVVVCWWSEKIGEEKEAVAPRW